MSPSAEGWASGKLILVGEHAVVHGQPAVAFAVSLGTTVRLTPTDGATALDVDFDDPRLREAVVTAVGEQGWRVHIRTDLPVGRGMGSSASLAVALVRAHAAATGTSPDVYARALTVERVFHGNPSGVDVAVATHGGVLRFQRTAEGATWSRLPCPGWQVVVLDSGTRGDTGALVAGVTARRPGIDDDLAAIGAVVDQVADVLDDPPALGPLLTENHRLLGRLGVSTPVLDDLVQLALDHGALGAKLSGAGGGGVVLALVDDPAPVLAAAHDRGVAAWATHPAEAP